ncbi:hypothetical protein [Nocardioides sediminis]|uniref:hypothetical protein n=1 Tax=Nocardioides sediminis TaxID=433648 RepID=UPI000D2F787A|nr:hypothetical protein [Nocardioides sediminis]
MIGVLVGGGLLAVTPAGAEVAQLAATNWKKIWKQELQPYADKRYYKKSKADKTFAAKADTYTKTDVWTRTESDARYQAKGSYATAGSSYTKAESDARYAPYPSLIRGSYFVSGEGTGSALASNGISFGHTFSAAPATHYIKVGDPVPTGCSGTAAAPNAAPGNLCVFEGATFGPVSANRGICNSSGTCFGAPADPFGASIYAQASGAGLFQVFGSWAARPSSIAPNPAAGARGTDRPSAPGAGAAR